MPMTDHLTGTGARRSEAEPVDHVVQSPLHDAQQDFPGVFRRARGELEIAPKLALEHAVEPLQFLLLTQAHAVFTRLAAAGAMHARRLIAALNGALRAFAPTPLQVELHAFAATQLTDRFKMTSHGLLFAWKNRCRV